MQKIVKKLDFCLYAASRLCKVSDEGNSFSFDLGIIISSLLAGIYVRVNKDEYLRIQNIFYTKIIRVQLYYFYSIFQKPT